jgi:hypothetical protein
MLSLLAGNIFAQGAGGRGGAQQAPQATVPTPKAAAPFDVTGYWVSMVTEDWRVRMVTPPKGDYAPIPLKPEARKIADAWDPAKDEASGDQCKSYGAVNIMRVPGRFHITWLDDATLKLESDAGMQTRVLSFGPQPFPASLSARTVGDWQGFSSASWELVPGGRGQPPTGASLKVVTSNMKPGYLRKNGVPYSDRAVLTEYFDRVILPTGDSYLVLTSTVEDPTYLTQPYITSTSFKKQTDASGWNPTPCTSR